jgi:hypothetical protein
LCVHVKNAFERYLPMIWLFADKSKTDSFGVERWA